MTTTFSPSLKLALMGTGDQSGTWGTTTNTNLGTLLEQAITGVGGISLTSLSSYTLTNLNGVIDDARNQVLVFTGSPASQVTIIAPLQNKFYVINNSTTQNILMTASGGAVSLVIPAGVIAQCYCDASGVGGAGTGFFSAQTGSAGNFVINGTLTATGLSDTGSLSVGGTLILRGASSGAVTISAPATAGSTTVSFPATTAAGVVMVSANMPTFIAYQSVSQTGIPAASPTQITFTSVSYDTTGSYNTSTSRYTPNVSGYYHVTTLVTFPDAGGTNGLASLIRKNGSTVAWGSTSRGANNQIYAGSSASAIIFMNGTTDYLDVAGYFATTTTGQTLASASQTYFQASMIRTA
jgi:hypothetical protein